MENAINTLRIQNFKSIKDVELKPRRVNLIIGQPNVGKSNILEAMSLLGAGLYENSKRFLSDAIRYEGVSNLFYDNDTSQPLAVQSDKGRAVLSPTKGNGEYSFVQVSEEWWQAYKQVVLRESNPAVVFRADATPESWRNIAKLTLELTNMKMAVADLVDNGLNFSFSQASVFEGGDYRDFVFSHNTPDVLPRKYVYRANQPHNKNSQYNFLQPPLGHNLLGIVQQNIVLRREMAALFRPYGLSLVLRIGERKFEIQKQVEDLVYNYPYTSIADTLQRIIFYLAAIESNDDSVILLEEPEAHTFPAYTAMLGQKIAESLNNQFFIATHSPYLLTKTMESLAEQQQLGDLAIFVAYYEDYQTKVYQLSDEEVREIRRDAIDVFYNLDRYTPSTNPYA